MAFDPFAEERGASAPFDPFATDTAPAKKQNKGLIADIGTDLKRGVQQIPGAITGLADIAVGAISGKPLISNLADSVGEATGFQPAKWAKSAEAEYSPSRQAGRAEVDAAWENGTASDIAGAYLKNPMNIVGSVAESLPSMIAGGLAGRAALGIGAKAVSAGAGGVGPALPGIIARTVGTGLAPAVGAGIGEGGIMAGQAMANSLDAGVDPRTAAGYAGATGLVGGALGALGGKVAQRFGVVDPETLIAGGIGRQGSNATGLAAAKEVGKRMAGGAISEGLFEELPQSVFEQGFQNLAQDKPLTEGMARAGVEGALAGSFMGGAFNAIPGGRYADNKSNPNAAPQDTPTVPPDVSLIADPVPVQKRIDAMLGLDASRMSNEGRKQYESDLVAAFNDQIGIRLDANQNEVPYTMGEYLDSQIKIADNERAKPMRSSANQQATTRLDQLAEEEAQQHAAITQDLVRSAAQGGALSKAALTGIQTGATQMPVHPERAAIEQQMLADEAAQAELAPIERLMRTRSDEQVQRIAENENANPKMRQVAIADLQRRMATKAQPTTTSPLQQTATQLNMPAQNGIKQLQAQLEQTEPFTEQSSALTEKLQSAVTQDAQSALNAGEMPVYKVTDHVSVAIHPSAQNPGMVQVTRYTKDGVIGDSQYNNVDDAVRQEGLTHKPRIASNEAVAVIEKSIQAESEYQQRKSAAPVTNADAGIGVGGKSGYQQRKAEANATQSNQQKFYVPPIVEAMIGTAYKSADELRGAISNVKYGDIVDGVESINFSLKGKQYSAKMTGRNKDFVLTGNDSETDRAYALRALLDGGVTQSAPQSTESQKAANREKLAKAKSKKLKASGNIINDLKVLGVDPNMISRITDNGISATESVNDLGEVAERLRSSEFGYIFDDVNNDAAQGLVEFLRRVASGDASPLNATRMEEDIAEREEYMHKKGVNERATELGLKKIGGKRTLQTVEAEIAAKEQEIAELEAREERAAIQASIIAEEIYKEGSELTEADLMQWLGDQIEYSQDEINEADSRSSEIESRRAQANAGYDPEEQAQGRGTEGAGTGEAQIRESGNAQGFDLAAQTNEQAAEQFAQQKAAKEKESADKKAADDKAKADAEANDFRLAGSDRAADVAIAGGQQDIFAQPVKATAEANAQPTIPKRGDRFKDGSGKTWEIWNARSSLIEAHPVVDGKPVVNRDSGQRFATDERARLANPEARTDFFPIAEEIQPADQPKPQGVQTGMFTADGRASADAQQKPAEPVAQPKAEPAKAQSDDWLNAMFGQAPSAEQAEKENADSVKSAQDKADRVDAAIAMLSGEIEANNAAAAELAARKYKANRKQIELQGDGPGRNGSMSISAINESRKRRAIEASLNASSAIKKAIEFISENPDSAFKQVLDMESAVTKQFNEGFFGKSAKLDDKLDMAVGSMIGAGSYSGNGSAGRKLRMAAHAYFAKAQEPATKELTAEQKIRAEFEALPSITMDKLYPITVEHNGVTREFIAYQQSIGRGNNKSVIHLANVKRGKMIASDDSGAIVNTFTLDGKDNLKETGMPRYATPGDMKQWTDAGFKNPMGEKPAAIDAAANEAATSPKNDLPQPTEAQIEAGNYKKGHVTLQGFDIAIENPKGSIRSGTDEDGKAWRTTMQHHYGYIKRTEGNDGDHVDVFIGPKPESNAVFIVNQKNPKTGEFDEHKVMLGFDNLLQAMAAYANNYAAGWMDKGVMSVAPATMDEFKAWLKDGDQTAPYSKPAAVDAKKEAETPKVVSGKQEGGKQEANAEHTNSLDEVTKKLDSLGIKHSIFESKGVITVSKIVVPNNEQGSGKGTEAMRLLADYADKTNKRIVLSPSSDFGGSKTRLIGFYKKFGFVENKGRNKDFSTMESMYRDAKETDKGVALYSRSKKTEGDSGLGKATIKIIKPLNKQVESILADENAQQVSVSGGNSDVVRAIAKRFGKNVIFYREVDGGRSENRNMGIQVGRDESIQGTNGESNTVQEDEYQTGGFVNSGQNGYIFLNVDSSNHLVYVLGHELGHTLRSENPALWKSMAVELQPLVRKWGEYKSSIDQKFDNESSYAEELFGDVIGQNFLNPEFWNDIAKQSPSLFTRIANAAIRVINNASKLLIGRNAIPYISDMDMARSIIAKTMAEYANSSQEQGKNTLFSKADSVQIHPITRTEAESRIKSILGDKLGKVLIDSGIVTFTNKGSEYQGATYKDGSISLNLDALNADNFAGVLQHEGFHSTIRDLVGEQTYTQMMKRLDTMLAMGKGAQWVKDADAAIPSDTKAEHRTEEIAAYSIEQYVNGAKQPNIIKRWVESLLSAIRTAIIQRMPNGKLKLWAIGNLQPQDLANLAIAGLKAKAQGQLQAQGREAMAYSRSGFNENNNPIGRDTLLRSLYYRMADLYDETDSVDDAFEAIYNESSPSEQFILRELKKDEFLGFDYPHQAISAIINEPESYDLSPTLKGAISRLGNARFSKINQTDTPAFRKWFGDSKVVDADGKPLVVYHGTNADFSVFKTTRMGEFGPAIYLTDNPREAGEYGEAVKGISFAPPSANIMPVYARIENPYTKGVDAFWKEFGRSDSDAAGVERAKAAGYDGIIAKRADRYYDNVAHEFVDLGNTLTHYIAFSNTQVKSAIGNNGDFGTNPDIRYSRAQIIGDSGRQYDQTQRQFFKNVGRDIDKKNLVERTTEYLKNDFWKKMAVGVVDQFRGLRDLGDNGQAYTLARLSKGTAGALDALLHHGKLSIRDGVYDADTSGGFIERIGVPLHGELDDFLWYVAANRAEGLSRVDRENLFTPADIAAGKSLAKGQTNFDYTIQTGPQKGTTTRNRTLIYADANRVFNEFQKNALDMAEQSGLIDGASRKLWESEFYVPFYRVSEEDGEFIGAKMGDAMVRQQAFKKLKGGTDKLNSDLLSNTLLNFSHLIEASAKNRAAKASLAAAEKIGAADRVAPDMASYVASNGTMLPPGTKGTVWIQENGKKVEYKVTDPFVMTAITSLEYAGMRNGVMDVMTKFKHWLTIGVTASPAFKVRNLIRDSIQSIGASDLSYNPIKNIAEGYKQTKRDSQEYVSALASGGLIRFGTMLEGSESSRVRQLVKSGVKDSTILNSENKWRAFYDQYLDPVVSAYNELGNRSEEINRAALYNQLIKQGKSHAEAALLARDLMDFSMQGSFNTIRFLTQVVPFMNARLQGMYKLGRAAKDNPRKLAVVTGAVALASIALMLAYGDDDDWKRREDWDRDGFWWFKMGGIEFRIPKPFEVGAIGSLAERGLELMIDDEMTGERFRRVVNSLVMNNLSMNPLPQAFKPILDLYANKDSFTGRPIESMGMQRLDPTERFNSNTSMIARGMSNASFGALSPVQIDHLARAYFGWLGSFVIGGADMAFRGMSDQPTKPALDYFKFGTQGILKEAGTGSSRYVTQVYEQAKELEQAHATYRQMIKDGRIDEAKDYAADNQDKMIRYRQVEAVKKVESNLNERIRKIERSDMDSGEKKDAIALINKQKEQVAKRITAGAS